MPVIGSTQATQFQRLDDVPSLTDEEHDIIKKRMEALDKLLREDGKAKFKIELFLGSTEQSRIKPIPGLLSFYQSGKKAHGGGDSKIYICPGAHLKRNDCSSRIPAESTGFGFLVCPRCGITWEGTQVIGEIFSRNVMKTWANTIYKYFRVLDMNADIVFKHGVDPIRKITEAVISNEKGRVAINNDKLTGLRRRVTHIYPLANIIKDISSGANLQKRLEAFLLS